jgi:hypothetical protein
MEECALDDCVSVDTPTRQCTVPVYDDLIVPLKDYSNVLRDFELLCSNSNSITRKEHVLFHEYSLVYMESYIPHSQSHY